MVWPALEEAIRAGSGRSERTSVVELEVGSGSGGGRAAIQPAVIQSIEMRAFIGFVECEEKADVVLQRVRVRASCTFSVPLFVVCVLSPCRV